MSRLFRPTPWALVLALLAVLCGVPTAAAYGQTASLVADLNTTGSPFNLTSPELAAAGGKLFFGDSEGLWTTDGTPSGPELLCSGCPAGGFRAFGRIVLFGSTRLWRSDGTRAGTFPLTDFFVPNPTTFLPLGGALYFQRCYDRPCELYRTDGTVAGTTRVDAVETGFPETFDPPQALVGDTIYFLGRSGDTDVLRAYKGGAGGSVVVATLPGEAGPLTAAGNRLFFLASPATGQALFQLWTSDGTAAGTRPVGSGPTPFPSRLHPAGGRVYFAANDGTQSADRRQLWTSDGTAAGTHAITRLARPAHLNVNEDTLLSVVGAHVVFVAFDAAGQRRLWQTDGTPASTSPLSDAVLEYPPFDLLYPVGNQVLFAVVGKAGTEIWSTDGTATGTGVFRGLCSGHCTIAYTPLLTTGGAYIAARDPQLGAALYKTDGTVAGTHRLTPYGKPDFFYIQALRLAEEGSRVFFFTNPHQFPELWVSDGTATRLVHEIRGSEPSALPDHLTALGDRLFFTACDGEAREVWQTDGSAATTREVAPLAGVDCHFLTSSNPSDPAVLVATSKALYLLSPTDGALLRTDGTDGGTVELATLPGVSGPAAVFGDRPWFASEDDSGTSPEITVWTSDGSPAGTVPAFSLPPGVHRLRNLLALGDALYFTADDPVSQPQLWRSDGTPAGTRKLTSFPNGAEATDLTRVGSAVYFVARDAIWKTDGTLAGTSIAVGNDLVGRPHDLRELAGALYFLAFRSSSDPSSTTLFRSDGTAAGTAPLRTFVPTGAETMVVSAGRLFLVVDDGEHGRELWASDGTAAGTALVRDIFPGPTGSLLAGLTVASNRLFFSADEGLHGQELWESDGTPAGTRLLQDLAPGLPASSPGTFAATADRLYFSADDGFHGRELWALPLAGPAGCQPSDPHLCLNGNRFQVEITWTDFQGHTGVGHAVALTADTGYFWFFDPGNVETVVKVLDARALNGAFWVFYGALSSVQYAMTVTDTQTGLTRHYQNLSGQLASVGDTAGFGPLGAYDAKLPTPAPAAAWASARTEATPATAATGVCVAGPTRLCLQGGRFAVEAVWKDFQGNTGTGTAVPLSGDTGYFWFFAPTNVEVMTKVLDGRALGGKFWFFYGALSNVEYTLTVTDTQTGAVKTYKNPSGQFGSVADTAAF